ncbi:hypothetical protein E3N88_03848 [Mikania micrantha]|uniref:Uncharacterized protein n=1 Tax=Mikania micrantha TaxID=192012 RepID=A0A5N6PVK2_9ASTR|nr:hypothetical protein E3N88_03848 [Mikania micrantha]
MGRAGLIRTICARRKIVVAKASHYEKEASKFKKQVKDNDAAHKLKGKEIIEGTKKFAAAAILKAKIQMAERSKQKGSDLWDKDLADWVKVLAKLTGNTAETSDAAVKKASVVETSMVVGGEDIGAGGGEEGAGMGDEDRIEKV